ncbi:hypothetical protein [Fibrella aquatilis]|uniref:MetA-pathway of phenol degradation n=1 Tax=Fibrella aquatilis TaxID=2817059 RepID=A0A939G6K4_9BACT|nr:hypothetical protein [Fibrella aquatilis]MBO0931970.1 hypothetical protein [Fibrella aquatilis]
MNGFGVRLSWRVLLLAGLMRTGTLFAQKQLDTSRILPPNPPVGLEVLVGTRYLNTQLTIRKPFTPTSRLAFFNVTISNGSYGNERGQTEFLSQSYICIELLKGLSIAPGVVTNYITGFRPTLGLNYVITQPSWSAVLLPRIDLRDERNVELFALVDYKPQLSERLSGYVRLQGLLNAATHPANHSRSYVFGRLGIGRKPYTIGLGLNYDNYGPERRQYVSYGLFARVDLFN